jgi:hypothetical protein
VLPPTRYSDRFNGISHLLIVLLIAGVAAVFPVSMSAHASADGAVTPVASHSVQIAVGVPSISRTRPDGWSPADRARKVAPAVVKKTLVRASVVVPQKIVPVRAPVPAPAPVIKAATVQASVASAQPDGYGCASALAYLQTHAAPGFSFECPGYAEGHQAMTCINVSGVCPGTKLIAISIPCAAAYMNEASNSWVLSGDGDAPIDPYGYCS